jgi:hypothetical protein
LIGSLLTVECREAGEIFMGREICKLPPSREHLIVLSISDEEEAIYRLV